MEDKENLRKMVEANLRSVTQSCKNGVLLDSLQKDYIDLLGTPIPYRDLGYSSLESMIRSMPDVIKLSRNNTGQIVAFGVADEATAHIVSLVSRQKDSKTRKPMFRRPYRMQASRGQSRYSSPFHSKRFHISSYTKTSSLLNNSYRTSQNQQSTTSSRPSWGVAETRQLTSNKDPVTKANFEVPPRFLRSQKGEFPIDVPVNVNKLAKTPDTELWDDELESPSPAVAVKPLETVRKPDSNYSAPNMTRKVSSSKRQSKPKRTVLLETPVYSFPQTAKEYVAQYAALHNVEISYHTKSIGQKRKSYISILKLGGKSYKTFPDDAPTIEEAEEMAAKLAQEDIEKKALEARFEETKIETLDEVLSLVTRIEEIVAEKSHGMWSVAVPKEYEMKFSQSLPPSWLSLVKKHASSTIEFTVPDGVKVPNPDTCILSISGSLSGTTTPTSTSSRASVCHEDDAVLDLNYKALGKVFQGVPRLVLPLKDEWAVLVTSVASTVDIAVNLIDYVDQFTTFCAEMTAFYEVQSLPVQKVLKKNLYVACIADEGINYYHRVRVEDVSNGSDLVTCYFVDRGDTQKLKLSNLRELDAAFENCAFQAVHMQLCGLEDYAHIIHADYLVKYLLDKTFIVKVMSTENNPVATLYDTSGDDDVNLNDLLREVFISQSLAAELPLVGSTTMAYLTYVSNEGDIFLRLANEYFHVLEAELEKLAPTFELQCLSEPLKLVEPETLYVAKYTDGMWYRAIVLGPSEFSDEVEVIYVDYGNTSWVSLSSLCKLETISKFLSSLPFQTIACTLSEVPPSGSQWTEEASRALGELNPDSEQLIVKVDHPGSETIPPKVSLFKRNEDSTIISINQTLAFRKELFRVESSFPPVAKPSSLAITEHKSSHSSTLSSYIPDVAVPAAEVEVQMAKRQSSEAFQSQALLLTPTPDAYPVGQSNDDLPPLVIPDSGEYDVFVTLACSPSNFVVQPMNMSKELNELQAELLHFYSCEDNMLELHEILLTEENLYAVLHSDGNWYRARVKEKHRDNDSVMVTVHFIDYGDYSVFPMANLQLLYNRFKKLPAQAIKASLAGVKPLSNDWDVETSLLFQSEVQEKSFVSVIMGKSKASESDFRSTIIHMHLVDTTQPEKDILIHEELIKRGLARPSN